MPACVIVSTTPDNINTGRTKIEFNIKEYNTPVNIYGAAFCMLFWTAFLNVILQYHAISPLWDAAHSRYYCFLTPSNRSSLFFHTSVVLILSKRVLEFRANTRTKTDCVYI